MPPTRWAEIQVRVSPEAAEGVADQMRRLAGGVAEATDNGVTTLTCYLPADDHLGTRTDTISKRIGALRAAGLQVGAGELSMRSVEADEWAEAWKAHFGPLHIGGRLLIRPSWSLEEPSPSELVITLDPGMAFGTGSHPTTYVCLEMICRLVRPGFRVADVGTGSGILAIAAAKLGATEVIAVDSDPIAVQVAQENAILNQVDAQVQVAEGDLLTNVPGRFDLIVANLVAEGVASIAPALPAALKPGGQFLGSGIVEQKLSLVEDALSAVGLHADEVAREGEWITVRFTLPAPSAAEGSGVEGAECRAS